MELCCTGYMLSLKFILIISCITMLGDSLCRLSGVTGQSSRRVKFFVAEMPSITVSNGKDASYLQTTV